MEVLVEVCFIIDLAAMFIVVYAASGFIRLLGFTLADVLELLTADAAADTDADMAGMTDFLEVKTGASRPRTRYEWEKCIKLPEIWRGS